MGHMHATGINSGSRPRPRRQHDGSLKAAAAQRAAAACAPTAAHGSFTMRSRFKERARSRAGGSTLCGGEMRTLMRQGKHG